MDVQARILAKAQIKSVELQRDSIVRNMRWRSRLVSWSLKRLTNGGKIDSSRVKLNVEFIADCLRQMLVKY